MTQYKKHKSRPKTVFSTRPLFKYKSHGYRKAKLQNLQMESTCAAIWAGEYAGMLESVMTFSHITSRSIHHMKN